VTSREGWLRPIPAGESEGKIEPETVSYGLDTRFRGTVKRENITGQAGVKYWSSSPEGVRTERFLRRIK
jgi:hypothetical protein